MLWKRGGRGGVQHKVSEESTCLLAKIHHTAIPPELFLLFSKHMLRAVRLSAVSVALRQLCNVCCSDDTADIRSNSKDTHKHIHMWKPSSMRHLLHVWSLALNFFFLSFTHILLHVQSFISATLTMSWNPEFKTPDISRYLISPPYSQKIYSLW